MGKGFTLDDLKKSKVAALNTHLFEQPVVQAKKSKYRNTKTVVDDIEFDSAKEAKRYRELKILSKAGLIGFLKLQQEYELNAGGTHSLKYVADFQYIDATTGETIVEDVKGFLTKTYKKKRRLMKKVYGITIKEI